MKRNEFFFKSKDNETNIHMVIWEPDNGVKGILQINHGLGEYILRYEEMANFLTKGDLAIVGIDLIGHGNSTNNGNKVMYFGTNGSYQILIEDINTCVDYIKKLYPDIPYAMLGYSIGATLTQAYMMNYGYKIDGMILVSPAYKKMSKVNSFRHKVERQIKKLGDKAISPKIEKVLDKLKKNGNSKYDYLLKSDIKRQEYLNDKFKGENVTLGVYRDITECLQYIYSNGLDESYKIKPVYILYGDKDNLVSNGKDVIDLYKIFKKCNYDDVLIKGYENIKRDILHEDNRYDIYNDIFGWIRIKLQRNMPIGEDQILVDGVQAVDDSRIKLAQEHSERMKQQEAEKIQEESSGK